MRHDSSKFDQIKRYIVYAIYFLGVLREVRWNARHIQLPIMKKYTKKTNYPKKWYIYKEVGWSPMYGIQIAPPQL